MTRASPTWYWAASGLFAVLLVLFVLWTWVAPGTTPTVPAEPTGIEPMEGIPSSIPSSAPDSANAPKETESVDDTQEVKVPSVSIRGSEFSVELATTPEARALGLSGRPMLPDGTGLLFVFPRDSDWSFWMKDMRFPIDMIWISAGRRIVHIERNVPPESFPATFRPDAPARYVLEVNAGVAERFGWTVGDVVEFTGIEIR